MLVMFKKKIKKCQKSPLNVFVNGGFLIFDNYISINHTSSLPVNTV